MEVEHHTNTSLLPRGVVSVLLSRQPQSLIRDKFYNHNLEPQCLRKHQPHRSSMIITSDKSNVANPVDSIISDSNLFNPEVNKLAVKSVHVNYLPPNVNVRNQTLTFFSSNSGINHTVNLVEGYYNTPTLIMTQLVASLNTQTGASGLTFSFPAISVTNPRSAVLNSAGGNYFFILTSSMMVKGQFLLGLPRDQVGSASKVIPNMTLQYTRWIGFRSSVLTQDSKNSNTQNSLGSSDQLFRFFHGSLDGVNKEVSVVLEGSLDWIAHNPTVNINDVDMRLYDEFGQLLYIPANVIAAESFGWSMVVVSETY